MYVNVFVDFVSAANYTFNIDKSLYFSPLINQTMPRSYPTLNIKLLFTWLLSPIFVDVEVPAKEAVKSDDEERGTNKWNRTKHHIRWYKQRRNKTNRENVSPITVRNRINPQRSISSVNIKKVKKTNSFDWTA